MFLFQEEAEEYFRILPLCVPDDQSPLSFITVSEAVLSTKRGAAHSLSLVMASRRGAAKKAEKERLNFVVFLVALYGILLGGYFLRKGGR